VVLRNNSYAVGVHVLGSFEFAPDVEPTKREKPAVCFLQTPANIRVAEKKTDNYVIYTELEKTFHEFNFDFVETVKTEDYPWNSLVEGQVEGEIH